MKMLVHFIWTTVVSSLFFVQVVSILVREPTDVFAVRNATVVLPCYTSLSVHVYWDVEKTGGGINWEHFYKGYGDIPDIYQYKYNVSVDRTLGQYNLTIRNVQPEDSGTYRCADNLGLGLQKYKEGVPGHGATAELVVIDDELKCRQEATEWYLDGEKFDDSSTGVIKMTCKVTYRGNISPNLYWSLQISTEVDKSGSSLQKLTRTTTTTVGENSIVSSEIIMNAIKSMDQSYIKCEITGLFKMSLDLAKHNTPAMTSWLSQKLKITDKSGVAVYSAYWVWLIVGLVLTAFIAVAILLVIFLRKRGYKFTNTEKPCQICFPLHKRVSLPFLPDWSDLLDTDDDSGSEEKEEPATEPVLLSESFKALLAFKNSIESAMENLKKCDNIGKGSMRSLNMNSGLRSEELTEQLEKIRTDIQMHYEQCKNSGFGKSLLSFHSTCKFIQQNPILGMAIMNDEIYVLREDQTNINVYDSNSLRASRDINIPDLKLPKGLASCAYDKALYIIDQGLMCIHRVDCTNNSVTHWEIIKDHEPWNLSVTAEGTLLVTVEIKETEREGGVVEYTSDGQHLRTIKFDSNIADVHQTVQLLGNSDEFIVSHGTCLSLNRVCVVNAEGQIMKFYGNEWGRRSHSQRLLNFPHSIATDHNSNNIYVADCYNNRVLMFNVDSKIKCLGEVRTPRTMCHPFRLCFDSETGRLFIGERDGRIIVVYPPDETDETRNELQ